MLAGNSLSGHHSIDTSKPVREMDVQDWAALVQAFHLWPFAPDVSPQLQSCQLYMLMFFTIQDLLITDSFSREERL